MAQGNLSQAQSNRDRMRRTRSRLEHSERISSIDDRFISLWITFNAAYGNALREGDPEADIFKCFIENIVDRDKYKRLERVLSDERFSERVRHLLNNPFIYRGFWESNDDWEQEFNDENRMLLKHLRELRSSNGGRMALKVALKGIFERLYTLRNQVFHGSSTFGGGRGRDQIEHGRYIMSLLVPPMLSIMDDDIKKNPSSEVWGKVYYSIYLTDFNRTGIGVRAFYKDRR